MFGSSRSGGVRGGQDQFNWDDVKVDKHRENYLGEYPTSIDRNVSLLLAIASTQLLCIVRVNVTYQLWRRSYLHFLFLH